MGSMMVGMVDSLNIPEEQFMNNKPAWLGDEPQLADKVEYTKDCEVLVIGAVYVAVKLRPSVPVRPVLPPPCAAQKRA